ncbi:hypothetical protein PIROE2DRAFT_13794 [Piromyces sp. E2]|nr:hypothetical protein PIROE2DRAFT_13794 [Piromyces sp. E2]|eukprot:OUM60445.1 hypothetical protein PIROE2DRAFT_13794 [Piromyces sp. E2]
MSKWSFKHMNNIFYWNYCKSMKMVYQSTVVPLYETKDFIKKMAYLKSSIQLAIEITKH